MNAVEQELLRRRETWRIYKYRPCAGPDFNDQLGFHQSTAQVRVILGANRSGKTQAMMAELAAVALGEPFPWWFNWEVNPKAPLTIWLLLPQFPKNPPEDARIKKLFRGERYLTRQGRWVWAPPLIPKEMVQWHAPDWSEVLLFNGTTISIKSTKQDDLAFSSNNVDFIAVDEPTESNKWRELTSRMVAAPHARMVHGLTDIYNSTEYLDELIENPDVDKFEYTTAKNPHTDRLHAEKTFRLQTREQRLVTEMGMRWSDTQRCYPKVFRWIDENTKREIPNKRSNAGTGNWIRPFPIPRDWTRYAVHDPGIKNAPTVWFAVAPGTNDVYAYRCCYVRRAGSNVARLCEVIDRANNGDDVFAWFIDPKAGKHTPRSYIHACTESTIDVYRNCSRQYGIKWALGPPQLENQWRPDRIRSLTSYLDPQDQSSPMMFFFDVDDAIDPDRGLEGMPALKYEFKRYRWDEKREQPVKEHDHAIYCCEAAATMKLRNRGARPTDEGWQRVPRVDPVAAFMNGDKPMSWKDEP